MATITIKSTLEDIAKHFLECGYKSVKVNIWKQRRVYVTLDSSQNVFCYELDNDLHIWSKDDLSRNMYRNAKKITAFIQSRKDCLMEELSNQWVSYTTDTMRCN